MRPGNVIRTIAKLHRHQCGRWEAIPKVWWYPSQHFFRTSQASMVINYPFLPSLSIRVYRGMNQQKQRYAAEIVLIPMG